MTSDLDRWERDPFFPAAEEVQESAERMESTYRTLIQALKEPSVWNSDALRTDLRTALGTTKWQLEEFERAVESSYSKNSTDDAKERHHDFISAMSSQISKVESLWNMSPVSKGKPPHPCMHLDEGERNELALFLSGSSTCDEDKPSKVNSNGRSNAECSKNLSQSAKEDKVSGHRRTASAGADMGSWKIAVSDDVSPRSFDGKLERKIPSFSGFLNSLESASRFKWSKNGYRKLRITDQSQESDGKLLETRPLTRGINGSHERSKSVAERRDDYNDKRLYGWYGTIRRRLQRSQYYMLHHRRTRMVFWVFILFCVLALVVIRGISTAATDF